LNGWGLYACVCVFAAKQCSIKAEEEQTGPSEEKLQREILLQRKPCWSQICSYQEDVEMCILSL